jgi:hypothetical protein
LNNPTVSGPLGKQSFKGVIYNHYQITWSTGQSWNGGAVGQVGGGGAFHVGASFTAVDLANPIR